MAEEKQLRTVKKMINAGMYDEARAALLTINHPLAEKWLDKLDQIAPSPNRSSSRRRSSTRKRQSTSKPKPKAKPMDDYYDDDDYIGSDYGTREPQPEKSSSGTMVVVMAILIGIGVLLVGGAFMLTQGDLLEPPITVDNTGCGGQEWVNAIDGSFNEIYRYNLWNMLLFDDNSLLYVDEELRAGQVAELNNRLKRLENAPAPDCVVDVRDKMIEAYEAQIRATEILNPHDPLNAFGLIGKTMRLMKESGTELIDLGAQFRRVDSAAIGQVVNVDCPAFEYVTRTMYIDNQFVLIILVDPQIQTLDAYYSLIRDLAQQYYRVKDDLNVPACLWSVRDQFVEMIDAYKSALEAALGNDAYGFEVHFERFDTALEQFYVEIESHGLDRLQFGG